MVTGASRAEQRNEVGFRRGAYNLAFYHRHNHAYRLGAGMHFFHSKQHDLLERTPLAEHAAVDARFDRQAQQWLREPPRTEPEMEYYSSYVSRAMHTLFRAIDWTHMHHEQTYDIMSYRGIPWSEKKRITDLAVRYYLTQQTSGLPRSPAPLDVTMRRAAVMMKPYFTYFRSYYPLDQSLFYVAHWWHPAVYEAMMIAGNGRQEDTVGAIIGLVEREVMARRPARMLLSREISPRYAQMTPESANIFDNLHMLHGIAYDLLAYEGWTIEQKRDELYRVIAAMGYQPGDEQLARKFPLPHPEHDPRLYPGWVQGPAGEMTRIMREMLMEMMPSMMPREPAPQVRERIVRTFAAKMQLGLAAGERPSVHEALMELMPEMRMTPGAMESGATPEAMVQTMLAGWRQKHGTMPDVRRIDMSREPTPMTAAG